LARIAVPWRLRLGGLIRDADTVVFVLSPASANPLALVDLMAMGQTFLMAQAAYPTVRHCGDTDEL
jgi:hypothetical protein